MPTVIPAEGVILERVLAAEHAVSPGGLSREAYAKFDAAQMKTAWGRRHRRRLALVAGSEVLASATQYDLAAVLDRKNTPFEMARSGSSTRSLEHRLRHVDVIGAALRPDSRGGEQEIRSGPPPDVQDDGSPRDRGNGVRISHSGETVRHVRGQGVQRRPVDPRNSTA